MGAALLRGPRGKEKTAEHGKEQHELRGAALQKREFD
jgi:hypothetical protein